ncbi:MAG: tetraacyldisaccharide 4'-kinase [Deltaproteobacteria bacterium]|nr:tetraacyldisaccharide 4'-kinase [Deltaproteobacteria bacterium]
MRSWLESLPRGGGGLARPLLAPLSALYGLLSDLRVRAYGGGWLKSSSAGRPVVSVGNLVSGGGGKTPLVDWLLRTAAGQGARPACLSRGYGRKGSSDLIRLKLSEGAGARPEHTGDEPAMLARRNPEIPFYIGASRVRASRLALVWDDPGLFIMDDGFQHLALARDLDLVLVDSVRLLGNEKPLPLGPLREPLSALSRAHALVFTRMPLEPEGVEEHGAGFPGILDDFIQKARQAAGHELPVFRCDYRPRRLRRLAGGEERPLEALRVREAALLCAIANPWAFSATIRELGASVARLHDLPDHDPYDPRTLAEINRLLEEAPADPFSGDQAPVWVTTEKDAVKLEVRLEEGTLRPENAAKLWVLEMDAVPEPAFREFFLEFLRARGLL